MSSFARFYEENGEFTLYGFDEEEERSVLTSCRKSEVLVTVLLLKSSLG